MEQPKSAITMMAKRLRRKVVDVEEYLEDNQAPLDPAQRRRIKHMNNEMREQLERIKQAWANRRKDVEFDKAYIDEINRIITDSEDDVRETIMESRKIMNMPNVSPSSATCEAIETSKNKKNRGTKGSGNNDKRVCDEDNTDAGQDIHMRRVGTGDRQYEGQGVGAGGKEDKRNPRIGPSRSRDADGSARRYL